MLADGGGAGVQASVALPENRCRSAGAPGVAAIVGDDRTGPVDSRNPRGLRNDDRTRTVVRRGDERAEEVGALRAALGSPLSGGSNAGAQHRRGNPPPPTDGPCGIRLACNLCEDGLIRPDVACCAEDPLVRKTWADGNARWP